MKIKTLIMLVFGVLFFTSSFAQKATIYDGNGNAVYTVNNVIAPVLINADTTGALTQPMAVYTDNVYNYVYDLAYPNPTSSITRITLPMVSAAIVYADVVNMNGNVMRSYQFAPGSYQLDVDLSTLPTGLYSVRVFGRDVALRNFKIVKQ